MVDSGRIVVQALPFFLLSYFKFKVFYLYIDAKSNIKKNAIATKLTKEDLNNKLMNHSLIIDTTDNWSSMILINK